MTEGMHSPSGIQRRPIGGGENDSGVADIGADGTGFHDSHTDGAGGLISGAGNDVFVARALAGETGKVIGIDMTEAMVDKARGHAARLGYTNVEFRLGEIENMPVPDNTADVVISNCVLNLVPNKVKAFSEMRRILKPGGHFSVSDVVLAQELPESAKKAAELYAGCVAGALPKDDYLTVISDAGFKNVKVVIEKPLAVPKETLAEALSPEELAQLDTSKPVALSITVRGEK